MAIQERRSTAAEFERFLSREENANRLFELIDGEIVEKMPTWEHGVIAANAATEINLYLRQHEIGRVAVESRHRPADDEYNDRMPDVSFVYDLSKPMVREGAAPFIPDLAIEIKSPTDIHRGQASGLPLHVYTPEFYLAHGAKMVWLVYPDKRLIEVLTADDRLILTETDTLDGGNVLPGFSIPVSSIFRGV